MVAPHLCKIGVNSMFIECQNDRNRNKEVSKEAAFFMAQTTRAGDLTSGPMLKKIILFSLPLAASSILQLLFNAADVVVVGRFAGSTALAAVGSNGALINLLVNLFVGLSLGANVVAARCFGAKDEQGVQNTVRR